MTIHGTLIPNAKKIQYEFQLEAKSIKLIRGIQNNGIDVAADCTGGMLSFIIRLYLGAGDGASTLGTVHSASIGEYSPLIS